jgi:hypothetical protein
VGETGAGQVSIHVSSSGAILGYNTGLAMAAFCCWYITSPLGDDSLVGDFGIIVCSVVGSGSRPPKMWTHSISKFGLILQKYSDIMPNSVNFSVCSSRREGN